MSLMSLLEAARSPSVRLISTDLFDTVLLRDGSFQSQRFAEAARVASDCLGVAAPVLTRMRQAMHEDAYRAVAAGPVDGDVSLAAICRTMAMSLGLHSSSARALSETEVATDIRHLSPNRKLLACLTEIALSGKRIVALSDTFYSADELAHILSSVVGPHPISEIYSSADLGLTKHRGEAFCAVEALERIPADGIVHIGDDAQADVVMGRRAGWAVVHLKRNRNPLRTRRIVAAGTAAIGRLWPMPRTRAWS